MNMMKKSLFVALSAIILSACGGDNPSQSTGAENTPAPTTQTVPAPSESPASDSSESSATAETASTSATEQGGKLSPEQAQKVFALAEFTGEFDPQTLTSKNCEKIDDENHCAVARIEFYKDINGDNNPEVLIIDEAETMFHYGNTGQAFALLTQEGSEFRVLASEVAIPTLLDAKGANGYPDIELGGSGFCFPVLSHNGTTYEHSRDEYEGKPCEQ